MTILQRADWRGEPVHLGEVFVLQKGRCTARCLLSTHVLGWELRLVVGDALLQSQVCGTQEDVLSTGERWNPAIQDKRWT